MKNTITINEQLNIILVSSTDDGSNDLIIHWNCDLTQNPTLTVAGLSLIPTSNDFEYTIPQSVWAGSGSFTFSVANGGTTSNFTVNQVSNDGNVMLQRISETEFTLGLAKSSNDISDKTVDVFDTITSQYPEIASGDKVSTLFGKIKKFFSDLKSQQMGVMAGVAVNTNTGSMELYSKDLNTITTSGFYNAMTCKNAPFNYMTLVVVGYYLEGYCTQTATDVTTGKVKKRSQINGTWTAWGECVMSQDIPTIQCGFVSITPSAANTPTSKEVTFPTPFAGVPTVVLTPRSSAPGTSVTEVAVTGTTKNGFNAILTRTTTTTTSVNWIAVYKGV